jgi:hypothetical protein
LVRRLDLKLLPPLTLLYLLSFLDRSNSMSTFSIARQLLITVKLPMRNSMA